MTMKTTLSISNMTFAEVEISKPMGYTRSEWIEELLRIALIHTGNQSDSLQASKVIKRFKEATQKLKNKRNATPDYAPVV